MDAYTPEPEYVEGPPTEITEEPAVIEEPAEEPAGDETDPQGPQPDVPEGIEEPAVIEEPTEDPVGDDALGVPEEPIEKPEEVLEAEAPDAKTESDEAALASSGSCGENVNWTLDGDTLTITGTGEIANFSDFNNPGWYSSRMDVKNIVIGSGVTRIGAYAFYQMIALRSVTIPSTVTAIGMDAFKECRFLRSLQLPSGLQTIGSECFLNCVGLSSLDIPAGVTVIGGLAFSGCSALKTVCFLGSAPTIYPDVFSGVTATVYYPGSDASWSSVAGQNYGGTLTWTNGGKCGDSVYWELSGNTLIISGSGAMTNYYSTSEVPWYNSHASIKTVTIASGVTSIGRYSFQDCTALTSVTIPDGVTSIGAHAFLYCSALTSLVLPASVSSIGTVCFVGCSALTSITVDANNAYFASKDGVLFSKDMKTLICCPAGKSGSYTIPNSVTSIDDRAFYGCEKLTSVTIPASVTSLGIFAFYSCGLTSFSIPASVTSIGDSAFAYCTKLTDITFRGSAPSIDDDAFTDVSATVYYPPLESWGTPTAQYGGTLTWVCNNKCGDNVTWFLSSDGVLTISGTGNMWNYGSATARPWYGVSSRITSLVVESGVTLIGASALFNCSSLTSVTIPEGVTSIGFQAFSGCSSLTSITIPEGVTSIGSYAFSECSSLTSVTIPEGVSNIGEYAFFKCGSLESVTIPSTVKGIPFAAFRDCTSLTSVTIPEGVTNIWGYAFYNCTSLTSVTIPESVTTISDYSFTGCSSLTSVTILEGVTSIGNYAFYYCDALTNVTIPESVTTIGEGAFSYCSSLTSVTIPESVTNIGEGAFSYCSSLTSVTIPESVTTIADYSFTGCSLTSITIPGGVASIGRYAFALDSELKEITFKGSAPSIGEDCFFGVTATAYYPANDASWTDSVRKGYGGNITWVAMTLTLEPNKLSLPVTETAQLKASGYLSDLKWTSSSEKTATVDQNGLVKANKYGKAMITATVPGTDLSASCEVQTLFWDVADPSQYYFKHVYWAAEAGITNGYDLEYFGPQLECTREQMMTFLWRMAGKPEPRTTKNPFPDVPSSAYYHKAVLWGVEKGITNGFSSGEYAGKFGVGLPCTREQAMTFLWRMAGKPNPSSSTNPFADIKSSDYYYKAVLWASQNGIANGYTSGEYAGKYGVGLACLREHMVTFLSRYNSKFN